MYEFHFSNISEDKFQANHAYEICDCFQRKYRHFCTPSVYVYSNFIYIK
jgi:hypothetical protein